MLAPSTFIPPYRLKNERKASMMALIANWMPPSKENWELVVNLFTFFPLLALLQWVIPWYGAGKTSANSKFNLPGKIAWFTMEVPGMITLWYVMANITPEGISGLPWESKTMAGIYTIHYIYRAIIFPLVAPSMSPIHLVIWIAAVLFQVINGVSFGGYLGGYGPNSRSAWLIHGENYKVGGRMELGMMIWALGFFGNIFHDDELREIRRAAARNQRRRAEEAEKSTGKGKGKVGVDKVYLVPQNGLFWYILYPHYFCEWIEWGGFWIMGGLGCTPARNFLLNEIATMLPRAVSGKKWYIEKFGKEKVGSRKAVIPGIL